jgi:hypothetical protein
MRQKELIFNNAVNGLKRDSVLPEDLLNSLHTLDNLKLKYEGGLARMIVRNGYERWNTEPTAGPVLQLYNFVNQVRDEYLMGVVDLAGGDRWYRFIKDSTHELLVDENATVPQGSSAIKNLPIITVGNRVMFGTDSNWRWADADSFYETVKSYQVGIDPPSAPPGVTIGTAIGQTVTAGAANIDLNATTHRKIAFRIDITTPTRVNTINLYKNRGVPALDGNVKIGIYTDSSGLPSSTLADENAQSDWLPVSLINLVTEYTGFVLRSQVTLPVGTYWIVNYGDDTYYANYVAVPFYVANLSYINAVSPTNYSIKVYDHASSAWGTYANSVGVFYFGGIAQNHIYDYLCTFYNSTYGIESRPSDHTRIEFTGAAPTAIITAPTSADLQVDKVRIYRRVLDDGLEVIAPEADITNKYGYIGEATEGASFHDYVSELGLGGELQTLDHYRIGEPDDSDPHVRLAVLPRIACFWKGRVFVAEGSNLYFSKRLEEDGASGLAGDPIPDYFPPENVITTYMASDINGLKPMGDDQLVLYFANSAIWVLMGFDSTLNPPDPAEYRFVQVVMGGGLIASSALVDVEGGHTLLTRRGLRAFSGTTDMPYLSESVKSILDAVTDEAIDNSLLINFGNELWLGIDSDADGYADEFYILDMLSSKPYWRRYDYGLRFGDVIVRESGKYSTGSSYKSILASDMDGNYILELEKGTTDNALAIGWEWRTHRLRVGRYSTSLILEFSGLYPSTPPTFTTTIRDHVDSVKTFSRTPSSSTDVRNHRMGVRFNSPQSLQIGMSGSSLNADEIWGFKLSYNTES